MLGMEALLALLLLAMALLLARARQLQGKPALGCTPGSPDKQGAAHSGDRVLVVTAHPDDEAMFFSPTILSLTRNRVPVALLCLSNGGAYGLGRIREKELLEACDVLGIPRSQVTVIDNPELQDGMKQEWAADAVAAELDKAVKTFQPSQVVTFDSRGVSGHPNHVAAYIGVRQYMRGTSKGADTSTPRQPSYFMLESTGLFRKFSGLLDLPVTLVLQVLWGRAGASVVVSPSSGAAMQAMKQHRSQLVWYRLVFVLLSRYTVINSLRPLE